MPFALVVLAVELAAARFDHPGRRRSAMLSGGLTSGVGYEIVGRLAGFRPVQAGLLQLAVPVLTALGGVAFLAERLSSASSSPLCSCSPASPSPLPLRAGGGWTKRKKDRLGP